MLSFDADPHRERSLWRLISWICRYGRQPVEGVRRLTVRDAYLFAGELGKLLKDEEAQSQPDQQ